MEGVGWRIREGDAGRQYRRGRDVDACGAGPDSLHRGQFIAQEMTERERDDIEPSDSHDDDEE